MKYRSASKRLGIFERRTPPPSFPPYLRFLAFHLTPGLSQEMVGWVGGDWLLAVLGLKCNPGPMTIKARPPKGQGLATFSELHLSGLANLSHRLAFYLNALLSAASLRPSN